MFPTLEDFNLLLLNIPCTFDILRNIWVEAAIPVLLSVLVNDSINQTLSRTVITTVLTLFSALALFFFGGEILRDFSLVLIIGMISGVYSTIFVASPIVYDVKRKKK